MDRTWIAMEWTDYGPEWTRHGQWANAKSIGYGHEVNPAGNKREPDMNLPEVGEIWIS